MTDKVFEEKNANESIEETKPLDEFSQSPEDLRLEEMTDSDGAEGSKDSEEIGISNAFDERENTLEGADANSADEDLSAEAAENAESGEISRDENDEAARNGDDLDARLDIEDGKKGGKNGKKKKRRRISDITFENDIKYRGPFSYRWLRIFAWAAIAFAQIAIIMTLGARVDAKIAKFSGLIAFFQIMGTMSVPLFLMANFAIIINAKNGYQRLIVAYAFMALMIFSLFMLIYQRYLLGIMDMLVDKEAGETPQQAFNVLFKSFSPSGYFAFNIFIDLLMCTLVTYFINYTPTKRFVGKKLAIFRSFVVFPLLYEIASFVLKVLCVTLPGFDLPLYVMPFLTTKPPITFLVFIGLSIFVKNRELMFLRRGKTREEYSMFLKTNTNSLHFSISASIFMIVAALLDLILYFVIGLSLTVIGEDDTIVRDGMVIAQNMGFGRSVSLLLVVPFIMLFSYTRVHKPSSSNVDIIIPLVGIMIFAVCYVEGAYQFILRLPQIIDGLMK